MAKSVKFKESVAFGNTCLDVGDVINVDDGTAAAWEDAGIVEIVGNAPKKQEPQVVNVDTPAEDTPAQ